MEELLKEVLSEVKGLKTEVGGLKAEVQGISSRMDKLETKFDSLETKVDTMDGQLRENTDYIKSLLHRTEELDAKFDGILHTTASKDAIKALDTKIDRVAADMTFLVRKAAEHEDDIRNLKLIK